MPEKIKPYLRDGVDVYLGSDSDITFVFLSTRKRIHIKSHPILTQTLSLMNGENSIEFIEKWIESQKSLDLPVSAFSKFLDYLLNQNLVVDKNWFDKLNFPEDYKICMTRQLHFLMDMLDSAEKVESIQTKISTTRIAVFGCGAIGSWLTQELVMMGFLDFKLFDFDTVQESDVSRHSFFDKSLIGKDKTEICNAHLKSINPKVKITTHNIALNIDVNLAPYLNDVDFIINAADDPYIGYTSLKLSRYCIVNNKPLFVAGGFDAHLASIGELIIPQLTPCSDCYAGYFKKSLENWKPIEHPTKLRAIAFGGLASMSVFSASVSALTILRYFIHPNNICEIGGRGEFLFKNYNLDTFEVYRDQKCKVCGNQPEL
jgi:molybdopterin/thiamine biosynthesis adenylyltransferase